MCVYPTDTFILLYKKPSDIFHIGGFSFTPFYLAKIYSGVKPLKIRVLELFSAAAASGGSIGNICTTSRNGNITIIIYCNGYSYIFTYCQIRHI